MLEIQRLSRRFGDVHAVDDVSFTVTPGRVTGFVGGNGAGKTTTMRMILGVLSPSGGEVLWDGVPITAEQRRRIGYMPEERGLYPRMKIAEQLTFLGRLYGADAAAAERRADELLAHFDLGERRDDLLDSLSLGNQQRVQIAAALIHRPAALVLDEPFSGLDPVAVDQMVDLLAREAADVPLLFSSHQLDLVERLCDDLVILSAGRIVASGAVEDLRTAGPDRIRITFEGADAAWLRDLRGIDVLDVDGTSALVELAGTSRADLLSTAMGHSPVTEFASAHQPLSDVYREVIR